MLVLWYIDKTAFSMDEGASLPLAFRGLRDESVAQGNLHADVAKELQAKVADPFSDWADGYKVRVVKAVRVPSCATPELMNVFALRNAFGQHGLRLLTAT